MKIEENLSVWFLWIFMYQGSWKLKKIKVSDFCWFSCTRGTFILPNCPEMMVNHVKNKVQAFQRSKTCPLVTKKWFNQEFEPISSREWHRKPYADSFITIPPQIAKLWPKIVSKCLIFVDFHVPSFYLITQKWWLITSKTMYKHFKGQKPVPWWPKNEPIKIWAHQ